MNLAARIAKLKARAVAEAATPALAADASVFWSRVQRYAESYPDEAAHTARAERVRHFNPAMHFAWGLRFEPETTTLADIMEQHGQPMPAFVTAPAALRMGRAA